MIDNITEIINIIDKNIESFVDRRAVKEKYQKRIMDELGAVALNDKNIAEQIRQSKQECLTLDNQLIPLYELREMFIQLKHKYQNKKLGLENWDDLVMFLNARPQREKDNRWLSLAIDAKNKIYEEMIGDLYTFPDMSLDYLILNCDTIDRAIARGDYEN